MKPKTTLLLGCLGAILAINLSIADGTEDYILKQTIEELKAENVSLTQRLNEKDDYGLNDYENEIKKTAGKIESDLRIVTQRFFQEDMTIHVTIEEKAPREFVATIGIATDLERQFYPELTDLIKKAVTMEHVQVLVVEK